MDMSSSLFAKFIDTFIGGLFGTMKESIADGILLLATLIYWLSAGKFRDHLWESVFPWVWLLCLLVSWHSIKAARLLFRELKQQQGDSRARDKCLILSQYGKPFEVLKAKVPKYRAKILVVVSIVLVTCGMCSYWVWQVAHIEGHQGQQELPPPPKSGPNVAVFMKCDLMGIPITMPPHTFMRLVPVNEAYMKANPWGSYEVRNDGEKGLQWPDKAKLLEAKRLHDLGVFVYGCDVSNHGQVNLLDVAVPMKFWFGDRGGEQNAVKYAPIISPLDAGQKFTLYFVNDCPTNASAVLPDEATIRVVGETERRTTKLNLPHRNPVDQIMMWFATKMKWIGATPCNAPTR
jgi:hypothetical protein